MTFAGINYLAVIIAAVAGWLAGAVYYGVLAKPWVAAHGKTMEAFKAEQAAHKGTVHAWLPFALAFLAELVMAYVLAGMVGHLGAVTIRSAVISGAVRLGRLHGHHHAGQQCLLRAAGTSSPSSTPATGSP